MSEFLPNAPTPTKPIRVPEPNTNTLLTPEELEGQRRFMSHPETFPDAFKAWLIDFIAVNGALIPPSQILGGGLLKESNAAQIATAESTSSTSYTNLSTTGPTLSGLSDGTYLILLGCTMAATLNSWDAYMSISINGAAASDSDGWVSAWTVSEGAAVEYLAVSGSRALLKEISNENNNTLTAKYKTGGVGVDFSNRWMMALKVGR